MKIEIKPPLEGEEKARSIWEVRPYFYDYTVSDPDYNSSSNKTFDYPADPFDPEEKDEEAIKALML